VYYIGLAYNNIGEEGATFIAQALTYNNTLTSLYMDANKIGTDGAKAIAYALTHTITILKELSIKHYSDIEDNAIGDDGAKAIAEALTNTLIVLSI